MTEPAETFHAAWTETANAAWQIAEDHGFHEDVTDDVLYDSQKMMLMVSEITEAFEEIRSGHPPQEVYFETYEGQTQSGTETYVKDKPEGVPIELADAVIRIMDYAVIRGIDLATAIEQKMAYNASRPYKHGRQF